MAGWQRSVWGFGKSLARFPKAISMPRFRPGNSIEGRESSPLLWAAMLDSLRRLSLGIVLIAGASALLLFSDLGSRVGSRTESGPKTAVSVALLQHASQPVLEDGVRGVLDGLAEQGFVAGRNLSLRRYNAEADTAVSNTIAREMANGGYDLLLTVSTPSLQAVANANRTTRVPHVFGVVTAPSATGVGISKTNPLDHPAWLAGYGTMQPIEQAFLIARSMKPDLGRVGVVWNAAETNSEAQLLIARQVCAAAGIELIETTVDGTAGVGEAAAALCARGVDAIFVPGDVTVLVAIDAVLAAANKAGIPVFTVIPPNAKKGALFDLGADYYQVGRHTGLLAGEVLAGRDPASVEIVNFIPETLLINEKALAAFQDKGWSLPDAIRRRATAIINSEGREEAGPAAAKTPPPVKNLGRPWNIQAVIYADSLPAEETLQGLHEGMKAWPLTEGRDYTFKVRSAQGDIAALNGIYDATLQDRTDIIIPISTPSLQAAIRRVRDRPLVFSLVANPIVAGAGKSFDDHLPNVTGVSVLAPADVMLNLLQKHFPQYRRIGTLYCPAESNSVDLMEILVREGRARGITVDTVPVNSPAELADAAQSLAGRPIDAIVQISDNITSAGFTAITKAARQARKPLFSLNSTTAALGAPVSFGRDYVDSGRATAAMVERVMRGESPASIPIILAPRVVRIAHLANARAVGMNLPPAFLEEMETVIKE